MMSLAIEASSRPRPRHSHFSVAVARALAEAEHREAHHPRHRDVARWGDAALAARAQGFRTVGAAASSSSWAWAATATTSSMRTPAGDGAAPAGRHAPPPARGHGRRWSRSASSTASTRRSSTYVRLTILLGVPSCGWPWPRPTSAGRRTGPGAEPPARVAPAGVAGLGGVPGGRTTGTRRPETWRRITTSHKLAMKPMAVMLGRNTYAAPLVVTKLEKPVTSIGGPPPA